MANIALTDHRAPDTLPLRAPVTPFTVTVVIPTLNECQAIGLVIDELNKEKLHNILVVDGHSEDGTAEIALAKGAKVIQQHGVGKAGALDTAAGYVTTPYMLVLDGDGTYPAADARKLFAHGMDFDEVIGARTYGRENIPRVNRFGNRLISRVFKLLFGVPITDVLSGMYLLRTERVREMGISSASFDVEVEMASNIAATGGLAQVPIGYRPRIGKEKLNTGSGPRIFSTLFWMAYYNNPLLLFGGLIALCAVPAAAVLVYTAYADIVLGAWHSGYALLGITLLLLATQGAAIAMLALLMKRSESRILRELKRITR